MSSVHAVRFGSPAGVSFDDQVGRLPRNVRGIFEEGGRVRPVVVWRASRTRQRAKEEGGRPKGAYGLARGSTQLWGFYPLPPLDAGLVLLRP